MGDVKKLMLLARLHETQQVKLSPEEGEAVLAFTSEAIRTLHGLTGRMPFDCEPAGYARALAELREKA